MLQQSVVLLVDDDPGVRQALTRALTFENFGVVGAANGLEALRGFGEHQIDVVLLDQDLGPEDGWQTLEQLRKVQPEVPVIIMTGRPVRCPARSVPGDEALMRKPLDLPLLFQTLGALAARSHERRSVSGAPQLRREPGAVA